MFNHSPAAIRFRASRGYLFSVVACASVLSALAVFQYLQRTRQAESHAVFVSTASDSVKDLPSWLEKDIHASFLTERALADARTRLVSEADADRLPANAILRNMLWVDVVPHGPTAGKSIRIGCTEPSPQGAILLRMLAERFIEERLTEPRANAAERLRAAQAAIAFVQSEYEQAETLLARLKGDVKRLKEAIREKESLVADATRGTAPEARPPEEYGRYPEGPGDDLAELERRLAALQADRSELLSQFTVRHPLVQDVNNRIAEVSAAIDAYMATHADTPPGPTASAPRDLDDPAKLDLAAIRRDLQVLRDELASLEQERDRQSAKFASVQEERRMREAEASRAQAELDRLAGIELRVTEAAPVPFDSRQLDASGLLFSLALGCLLGFVTYLKASPVTRRLGSRAEIESILALPVVGLLPGTGESTDPVAGVELPGLVRRVRTVAELTLALFLLSTAAGVAVLDGYNSRLVAEPLSTTADSLREIARHIFA